MHDCGHQLQLFVIQVNRLLLQNRSQDGGFLPGKHFAQHEREVQDNSEDQYAWQHGRPTFMVMADTNRFFPTVMIRASGQHELACVSENSQTKETNVPLDLHNDGYRTRRR